MRQRRKRSLFEQFAAALLKAARDARIEEPWPLGHPPDLNSQAKRRNDT